MIALYFKGYTLCDGCSHGVHTKHVNVSCQCDLCLGGVVMSLYCSRQIWAVRAFGWQIDIRWDGWLPLSVREGRNEGFGRVIRLGRRVFMVIGRLS